MDILNALVKHYDAMAAAGNATPFGWTHKFAQYAVEVNYSAIELPSIKRRGLTLDSPRA